MATDEDDPDAEMKDWYDRSSLTGDIMVMIADQTEEDYLRRCPEGRFCEFIDGIVYLPDRVTIRHQSQLQFLACLMVMVTNQKKGVVLPGPTAMKLRPGCFLEPDISVLPPGGKPQFDEVFFEPPALLVVEILSNSTRSHDLERKAELYRQAGVVEVWLVDDRDQVLIIHRRTDDGYAVDHIKSGPYLSRAIPDFWIEVSWLWETPEANFLQCAEAILAGPPA